MGGAGGPPAPVGDPPTGTAASNFVKRWSPMDKPSLPIRPASRRTEQAGRLCYQQTIFQTRAEAKAWLSRSIGRDFLFGFRTG